MVLFYNRVNFVYIVTSSGNTGETIFFGSFGKNSRVMILMKHSIYFIQVAGTICTSQKNCNTTYLLGKNTSMLFEVHALVVAKTCI